MELIRYIDDIRLNPEYAVFMVYHPETEELLAALEYRVDLKQLTVVPMVHDLLWDNFSLWLPGADECLVWWKQLDMFPKTVLINSTNLNPIPI